MTEYVANHALHNREKDKRDFLFSASTDIAAGHSTEFGTEKIPCNNRLTLSTANQFFTKPV